MDNTSLSNDMPNECQSNVWKELTLLPPVQFNKLFTKTFVDGSFPNLRKKF
jgi:hypothetical protein